MNHPNEDVARNIRRICHESPESELARSILKALDDPEVPVRYSRARVGFIIGKVGIDGEPTSFLTGVGRLSRDPTEAWVDPDRESAEKLASSIRTPLFVWPATVSVFYDVPRKRHAP